MQIRYFEFSAYDSYSASISNAKAMYMVFALQPFFFFEQRKRVSALLN